MPIISHIIMVIYVLTCAVAELTPPHLKQQKTGLMQPIRKDKNHDGY